MKLLRWVLPLVLFVPFAQFTQAQSDDWGIVKQLPQGQKVKVVTADRKSHQGAVQSVTDNSIQLENGFTAAKQDVRIVLIGHGGHHLRNAVIGAGIGAGTGAGVGAAFDSQSGFWGNNGVKVGVPAFAVVGLAIGAVIPSHGRWHEVYRAR
jgi:hypothetical protein